MKRGKRIPTQLEARIIELLANSDLNCEQIAERCGMTRNGIHAINRRHQVRTYINRVKWRVNP